jgi:hypothetical protein
MISDSLAPAPSPLWLGTSTAWATAKLMWGLVVRTGLQSICFDGTVALLSPSSRGRRKNAFIRSVSFCCCEVGVSLLLFPSRFVCSMSVARSLLDMALPGTSEILAVFDSYDPSMLQFLSLQSYPEDLADLTIGFMAWQIPCVFLHLALLVHRRRRLGAARTRTKRSLAVIVLLAVTRMYLTSFCVNPPETEADAISATVFVAISGMCQSYLARHLWPWDDHARD